VPADQRYNVAQGPCAALEAALLSIEAKIEGLDEALSDDPELTPKERAEIRRQRDAARAGASGFLLKRTRPEELIAAVHTIAAGDSLLSPSVTRRVIDRMAQQPTPQLGDQAKLDQLTPREREVLELIARGLSNREIATALVVEDSTIRTHVKRILMKLDLRDRVQAVMFAYETGVNPPGGGG